MKDPILDDEIEANSATSSTFLRKIFGILFLVGCIVATMVYFNKLEEEKKAEALLMKEQRELDSLLQKGYEALEWLDSLPDVSIEDTTTIKK
jgi:hypothetical protein